MCIYTYIVNPNYLQVLCLRTSYWLTRTCSPHINTYVTSVVICRHAQSGQTLESPDARVPSELEQGNALPSCFSFIHINKCPLINMFNATIFHIVVLFCWWFCYWNGPQVQCWSTSCLVFLSSGSLGCALRRKYATRYSAAGCELNVNESTTYMK